MPNLMSKSLFKNVNLKPPAKPTNQPRPPGNSVPPSPMLTGPANIDDYTCPVCFGLAWVPVRLRCSHVFCIRCVVKLQRQATHQCPLCRKDVVMKADAVDLDSKLVRYIEKNFPEEVKAKQRDNEIERGKELFGEGYEYTRCNVM